MAKFYKPTSEDTPEYIKSYIDDRKAKINAASAMIAKRNVRNHEDYELIKRRTERSEEDYKSMKRWQKNISDAKALLEEKK